MKVYYILQVLLLPVYLDDVWMTDQMTPKCMRCADPVHSPP